MNNIAIRQLVFKYGAKDLMSKTLYPEVITEEMEKNNLTYDYLINYVTGFNPGDMNKMGTNKTFALVKNINSICDLIYKGIEVYDLSKWKELRDLIRVSDRKTINEIVIPGIAKQIRITQKHYSVMSKQGILHISNRMLNKENLPRIIECFGTRSTGASYYAGYMKNNIDTMRIMETEVNKKVMNKNIGTLMALAEYWGITMNELMGWNFNPDEYLGYGIVVTPSENLIDVSVMDREGKCEEVQMNKNLWQDITSRGLLSELNRRDGKLHIGNVDLTEYGR